MAGIKFEFGDLDRKVRRNYAHRDCDMTSQTKDEDTRNGEQRPTIGEQLSRRSAMPRTCTSGAYEGREAARTL